MKELRLLLISIFLVFSGNVFSQTEDFKEMTGKEKTAFINQMQLVSKETTSLQCNFIQKKEMSMLKDPSLAMGIMYYAATNNLRWEYVSPRVLVFIMNKGKTAVKDKNGVVYLEPQADKMINNMTDIIIGMINGSTLSDSKSFTANYSTNQKQVLIKLNPKRSKIKMAFSSIHVYVDAGTYLAEKIIMNEAGGDVTTILLSNIKRNTFIADDKFNLN
ncbi:MAG TPA: outer membrane lipoprotein carrier protein LolA [Bacteroidales bacterium]|jgi:outer membrane lipoprotein-sorting protein|nr:outer membrane lipoprotein carrier protein LolA [Bacteroidales bacterium]HQB19455.1 outer membrane lipoprotein carrier protein LolA [Bacteroidales bacterium]